jgi:DNA-dependent RNA polymerase auxiliary subunit epsilon
MTTATDNTDLNISSNEYVAFDALALRNFITTRLNESGVFTDQNYEGSNITAINNIIAYSFHTLMYYLNQTSTETMFSEAQLYENINRIVKVLNYSPIGNQTSTLTFLASASEALSPGTYTIPRYSLIRVGNASFSFNADITFTKTVTGTQYLSDISNQYLLYQGSYIEYPLYTARGEANEIIFLVPGENVIIDHFNVDVYIKSISTNVWKKWTRTESLYLENATAEKYEIRLNQNKNYEIKFGDDINGLQLQAGDVAAVYYLQSAGTAGQVGANTLVGQQAALYTTSQWSQIKPDVTSADLNLLTDVNIVNLNWANNNISTTFTEAETVESIRKNAPASFKSQYRVVTSSDYEAFITATFANIINDVKVLNNNEYVNQHLKYLYDIGLTNPGQDYRVLFNQMAFADACNFNNVYVYTLPKATKLITNNYVNYLTPAQKTLIISTFAERKTLTSEVIVMDPVYKAVTVGTINGTSALTTNDITTSRLVVTLDRNTKTTASVIKDNVKAIFEKYFNPNIITLGYTVNTTDISNEILALNGVKSVTTTNGNETVNGVSFIVYNPSYPLNDITTTTKTFTVGNFQTVYLDNITDLLARTVVQVEVSQDTAILNF